MSCPAAAQWRAGGKAHSVMVLSGRREGDGWYPDNETLPLPLSPSRSGLGKAVLYLTK